MVYIGQRGGKLNDIVQLDPNIDEIYFVNAGKFRRYNGAGLRQFTDIKTQLLNIRDLSRIFIGFIQSWILIKKIKPSVIFTRAGYISVPVAYAAYLCHVKYITHDSDSTPSLANRLIAPKATLHLVALDPALYPYQKSSTIRVGVPISEKYKSVSAKDIEIWRNELKVGDYNPVILITGGGNGAKKLNNLVLDNVEYLLKKYPNIFIIHLAGRGMAVELNNAYDLVIDPKQRKQVVVKEFVSDLYKYSGIADVIVCRGGATSLNEFAAQEKACVVIPSSQLLWNVRNAELLAKEKAVVVLNESQAEQERRLAVTIIDLLDNTKNTQLLKKRFAQFIVPGSARMIAELIIKTANDPSSEYVSS